LYIKNNNFHIYTSDDAKLILWNTLASELRSLAIIPIVLAIARTLAREEI
jgi:hypothetical protein